MTKRNTKVLAGLLLFSAAGCADLEVDNPNAPATEQVLSEGSDVQSLIGSSYRTMWYVQQGWQGMALALSVGADAHSSSWGNFMMKDFSSEPRTAIDNRDSYNYSGNLKTPWYDSYRAVKAVNDGLKAIDAGLTIKDENGSDQTPRARAFAKFIQGIGHGTLALLYDRAFVFDETYDPEADELELQPYPEVMQAAIGYLQEAIQIAETNTFTIPETWVPGANLTNERLARLAHSYIARYMAQVARTPQERQAADWNAIISHVDQGIQQDFEVYMDDDVFWSALKTYPVYPGWGYLDLRRAGQADTTGAYEKWIATPVQERQPFLIHSPDARFPKGTEGGLYTRYSSSIALRPERGTYHFSNYTSSKWDEYITTWQMNVPEATVREMQLLKAEGLYRNGQLADAAAIINETRVGVGGLPPATASGIPNDPASCVPQMPDGSCGDLFEALKWEKRWEVYQVTMGDWFFDSRGWGDLVEGTALQFPIPAKELEVLQMELYTFGGEGEYAASGSLTPTEQAQLGLELLQDQQFQARMARPRLSPSAQQ